MKQAKSILIFALFLVTFLTGCTIPIGGETYAQFTLEDVISIFENKSEPANQIPFL